MAPFEVRYARPFYLSMLVIGMMCCVGAVKILLDQRAAGQQEQPLAMWLLMGAVVVTIGAYSWRALRRLTTPLPAIAVRDEGMVLTIGQPRLYRWAEITAVEMGRHRLRQRLEISVTPERFTELNLPKLIADDNFMAVGRKPDTIGITGQGLDRSLAEILVAVRARRADLVIKP